MQTQSYIKRILPLALPMAFQLFMLALVSVSDAVILGRLNQNSMAAVSLAAQVTFVFFSERIMLFFTNERELVTMGSEYLRMIGISYLLSAIAQVCMTIMKNFGAIRLSTVISSVTVILNMAPASLKRQSPQEKYW